MRIGFLLLSLSIATEVVLASRYFSGSFSPYPACDSQYNAPCSFANAFKAVQQAVSDLSRLSTAAEVEAWLYSLNQSQYDNGVDGSGFGPLVVSETGEILADPENPTLAGANLSNLFRLQSDICSQEERQQTYCAIASIAFLQEDLLIQWQSAAASDGWAYWIWTTSVADNTAVGTIVPEKKVGYVQGVSTQMGNLLVASSFSDQPLASGLAADTTCSSSYDELCSVDVSRMLVGSGLTSMMMASTKGDLTRVFWDITFSDTYRAGDGFYTFAYRFGPEGSPGERGECVAHGANSGHVGQNLPEILLKVNNTGVNGTALHDSFSSAAEDGGGWVAYEWRNTPVAPVGFKIAFIAGTEKFGTKYYLGVGFDHQHPTIAPGPHCSTCSSRYSYTCAIRNTYILIGHVQAFLLTDVEENSAWSQLTTSNNHEEALVAMQGTVEEAGYKFGGVGDSSAFYSFVYDFNGTCVAHASNGGFVGRTLWGILVYAKVNTGCDGDDLNCNVTLVDGWQLNEDFKSAAAGGGWFKYKWRNNITAPAVEKSAYIVQISKYGRDFYAGVGYNTEIWNPDGADCSADFAGACSEDSVVAIVGHLTAAVNNAQNSAALDAIFSEATNGTGGEYRRPGGFALTVYDESALCVASGEDPGHVGMTLEDIFLQLGPNVLSAGQYITAYQRASSGSFFRYSWQTAGMDTPSVWMAFAQKASYNPLARYGSEVHFYVVSRFKDTAAPPRCGGAGDAECPDSAVCDSDSGYCHCQAGFIASFTPSGSCGEAAGCTCDTWDYTMTCEVNPCPAGRFGTMSGTCQECDPGKFAGSARSSECSVCAVGRYQDSYGQTSCHNCTAGTSVNAGGSTACKSCMEGWFQDRQGSSACEKCPYGTFSISAGSMECTSCPVGHETTVDRAAISQWECICEDGWFRGAGHSEAGGSHQPCRACREGMECALGNSAPLLLGGVWTSALDADDRDYSVFRCRNALECPGGDAGTCALGREGVGCANCMSNQQPDRWNGECTACSATSVVPIVVMCCLAVMAFVSISMYASVDASKIRRNTLAVGICMGQAAVAVQALAVFDGLDVDWIEPIKSFLVVVLALSLDLDILGISCVISDSNVLASYAVKVLIFPTCIAVLCAMFVVMSLCLKHNITFDHVVNSIGLLFLVVFLTLAMLSLTPFYCASSPNGSMSLVSNPSVICFDSDTWTWLAVFGALAILVYVVLFYSWVTYVTLSYPSMIASQNGMAFLSRHRFMFQRLTVECYWFTPVYLARNFTITVLPVVFADDGHRQVIMLSSVLMFFGFAQSWLKPWRGFLPNLLDAIITFCLVMALVCAALLDNTDYGLVVLDMQVLFTVLAAIMCMSFLGFMGFLVWRRSHPPTLYAAFLCHHKLGCAAGARLMKIELESHLRRSVFLDSDELNNLEDLLDIVRARIGSLIVLLTANTLSRPWCAGEIATAFDNGVPIVPVSYDDYTELALDDLQEAAIALRWPPEAFTPCLAHGVSLGAVANAYTFLRIAEKIPCPRVAASMAGSPEATLEAAARAVAVLRHQDCRPSRPGRAAGGGGGRGASGVEGHLGPATAARTTGSAVVDASLASPRSALALDFAVLANYADGESVSAARVLSWLVRAKTQWQTAELLRPCQVQQLKDRRHQSLGCLCVLLTNGCLASEGFPKTLASAFDAWGDSGLGILMVSMTGFEFPTSQVLSDSVVPQVAAVLCRSEEEVAKMYSRLLSVLAIPFSPHDHISILNAEVDGILRRISSGQRQRRGSAASAPSRDPQTRRNADEVGSSASTPCSSSSEETTTI